MSERELERFMAKVEKTDGCWLWTAGKSDGYGAFKLVSWVDGKRPPMIPAHRASYAHFMGPIPEGMWVLHHCDVPACVNPAHLYVGTVVENVRDMVERGGNPTLNMTHCRRGHEFTPENTYVGKNGERTYRSCRTCMNAAARARYHANLEENRKTIRERRRKYPRPRCEVVPAAEWGRLYGRRFCP